MGARRVVCRMSVLLALVLILVGSSGCTYLRYRAEDFAETVDVGVTLTETPQIGLYWNSLDIFPVGYSDIDGWFVGWGGGQFGRTRHYNKCWGLGYAREEIGWGKFDKDDKDTLDVQYSGILGMALPPYEGGPSYTPACVHFFPHLGYVGLVWNARWMEMVDFIVGWTTIDIAGDDGAKLGTWSFPGRQPEIGQAE